MSSEPLNPFAAPQSPSVEEAISHPAGQRSDDLLHILRTTRNWARVVALVGTLMCVLMTLGMLPWLTLGLGLTEVMVFVGLLTVYGIPTVLLWQMIARTNDFLRVPEPAALVQVVRAQRNFWQGVGAMLLVMLLLGITLAMWAAAVASRF